LFERFGKVAGPGGGVKKEEFQSHRGEDRCGGALAESSRWEHSGGCPEGKKTVSGPKTRISLKGL